MKPITNLLIVLALVCYIFLPLFNITYMGSLNGLGFTSSLITYGPNYRFILYALTPFITLFLAIGFNCLKSRYWGIIDAILLFMAIFFFVGLLANFKGISLAHDPAVIGDTEMSEGMPINSLGIGYYLSAGLTILAFISALVSLMPFSFNKRLEESIDKRFVESRKHISKMGHGIHDEIHRRGKQSKTEPKVEGSEPTQPVEEAQPEQEDV
ncbi:MAG: hypothetical protein IJ925_04965 [Muribaculaceae bacterium]|nr:hypothetical protein [Muribaculaceae bacterium]